MKTKKEIKKTSQKVKKIVDMQAKVDSTIELVKEVEAINLIINGMLYTKDNFIIDLKNFSIMSITPPQELR